jgi:hypothetical protein
LPPQRALGSRDAVFGKLHSRMREVTLAVTLPAISAGIAPSTS